MIVIIDTDILEANTSFAGRFWRIMATRPESWGIRVVIPWVVREELIAHQERDLIATHDSLQDAIKQAGRLGLHPANSLPSPTALTHLRRRRNTVADQFDRLRALLRFEVTDPTEHTPEDLAEVVRRAIFHKKPFKEKGEKDGTRDCLNWLDVLRLAQENEDDDVIWVSNNSVDFGDSERVPDGASKLHDELIVDLTERGLVDRVSYVISLNAAIAIIERDHVSPSNVSTSDLLGPRIVELVAQRLTDRNDAYELDPDATALPWDPLAAYALVDSVAASGPVQLTELKGSEQRPFVVRVTAQVRLIRSSRADGTPTVVFEKELLVSGTATVKHDNVAVADVSVDDVTADSADPQLDANRLLRQQHDILVSSHLVLADLVRRQTAGLSGSDTATDPLLGLFRVPRGSLAGMGESPLSEAFRTQLGGSAAAAAAAAVGAGGISGYVRAAGEMAKAQRGGAATAAATVGAGGISGYVQAAADMAKAQREGSAALTAAAAGITGYPTRAAAEIAKAQREGLAGIAGAAGITGYARTAAKFAKAQRKGTAAAAGAPASNQEDEETTTDGVGLDDSPT